jgi:hypothetical protein
MFYFNFKEVNKKVLLFREQIIVKILMKTIENHKLQIKQLEKILNY